MSDAYKFIASFTGACVMCEVCHESAAKYKCPGCLLQTCSLPCVKQHKTTLSCNGQRDKTAYIAVKEFTDLNLLSDYRFLEDANRKQYGAFRDVKKRSHNIPGFLRELQKQARSRKIDLQLMPYPMSKRRDNFTTYNFKSRSILWQVEWVFPQAESKIVDRRLPETSIIESLLNVHLGPDGDPVTRHKLKPYSAVDRSDWRLFMKVENTKTSEKKYHVLDITKSLTENLTNKTVIEYPTIFIVLRKQWDDYPTITTAEKTSSEATESDSSETPS